MNILIVGCRKVGSNLASELSREGHDVSVVDNEEAQFEMLASDYSGYTTVGIPIDQDVLKKAGIENCDAVAAVSDDDNVNIMVSQLAKEIFKIDNVLARIYDPRREDVFSHFGLHTVCPTKLTVSAVKHALTERYQTQSINIDSHTVNFITVDVPKSLVGKSADNLEFKSNDALFSILHDDFTTTLFKGQKIILKANDKLVVSSLID